MIRLKPISLAAAIFLSGGAPAALAQTVPAPDNVTRAGTVAAHTPTLHNLGFEWSIAGDDNRNAAVALEYRKRTDRDWRRGMPLLRLRDEQILGPRPAFNINYSAPNSFAGSVLDLEPDTNYVVRLTISDPDGVVGTAVRELEMRTRAEPMPAKNGRVFHVYPADWKGSKEEPSFVGLLNAYNNMASDGDWHLIPGPRVQPGDTILVHAGLYKESRFRYAYNRGDVISACCGLGGIGTYFLQAKGTPELPIAIKAAGDGEVIFDGDGVYNLFNVLTADYNYFEGLTVRNTDLAFEAGQKGITGAKGLTFKNMKFENVRFGIHTESSRSSDFYIADSVFVGRNEPSMMVGWTEEWRSDPVAWEAAKMLSEYAIKIYGPGHIIAYNAVYNFHDGIDHATYGTPDGWPNTPLSMRPNAIDIYNNYVFNMHDNCIETDGAMSNIRVMRNVCFNSGHMGYSLQPVFGGPAYFIRNIVYHSNQSALKLSYHPAGGVFYHNTFVQPFAMSTPASNFHSRNNIFLQEDTKIPALHIQSFTNYTTSDYNGYQRRPGSPGFRWDSPPFDQVSSRTLVKREFESLADLAKATGQEQHGIMLDYSALVDVAPIPEGAPETALYYYKDFDFRLRRGSTATDRGVPIPNVNDGFSGAAPDLGAAEYGKAVPWVGPRSGSGMVDQKTAVPSHLK